MRDLKYEKEDLEVVVKKRDNTIKYRDQKIEELEEAAKDAEKDYDDLLKEKGELEKEYEELKNKEPSVVEKPESDEKECQTDIGAEFFEKKSSHSSQREKQLSEKNIQDTSNNNLKNATLDLIVI